MAQTYPGAGCRASATRHGCVGERGRQGCRGRRRARLRTRAQTLKSLIEKDTLENVHEVFTKVTVLLLPRGRGLIGFTRVGPLNGPAVPAERWGSGFRPSTKSGCVRPPRADAFASAGRPHPDLEPDGTAAPPFVSALSRSNERPGRGNASASSGRDLASQASRFKLKWTSPGEHRCTLRAIVSAVAAGKRVVDAAAFAVTFPACAKRPSLRPPARHAGPGRARSS